MYLNYKVSFIITLLSAILLICFTIYMIVRLYRITATLRTKQIQLINSYLNRKFIDRLLTILKNTNQTPEWRFNAIIKYTAEYLPIDYGAICTNGDINTIYCAQNGQSILSPRIDNYVHRNKESITQQLLRATFLTIGFKQVSDGENCYHVQQTIPLHIIGLSIPQNKDATQDFIILKQRDNIVLASCEIEMLQHPIRNILMAARMRKEVTITSNRLQNNRLEYSGRQY